MQQLQAAFVLVDFVDLLRCAGEHCDTAEEALVRFVVKGHGAEALPPVAAQLVEAAVVAGPRERVRADCVARVEGILGELRPSDRGGRALGGDLARVDAGRDALLGLRVSGQAGRGRSEQITKRSHGDDIRGSTASPAVTRGRAPNRARRWTSDQKVKTW